MHEELERFLNIFDNVNISSLCSKAFLQLSLQNSTLILYEIWPNNKKENIAAKWNINSPPIAPLFSLKQITG